MLLDIYDIWQLTTEDFPEQEEMHRSSTASWQESGGFPKMGGTSKWMVYSGLQGKVPLKWMI